MKDARAIEAEEEEVEGVEDDSDRVVIDAVNWKRLPIHYLKNKKIRVNSNKVGEGRGVHSRERGRTS